MAGSLIVLWLILPFVCGFWPDSWTRQPNAPPSRAPRACRAAGTLLRSHGPLRSSQSKILFWRVEPPTHRLERAELAPPVRFLRSGPEPDPSEPPHGPSRRSGICGRVRALPRDAARQAPHAAFGLHPGLPLSGIPGRGKTLRALCHRPQSYRPAGPLTQVLAVHLSFRARNRFARCPSLSNQSPRPERQLGVCGAATLHAPPTFAGEITSAHFRREAQFFSLSISS